MSNPSLRSTVSLLTYTPHLVASLICFLLTSCGNSTSTGGTAPELSGPEISSSESPATESPANSGSTPTPGPTLIPSPVPPVESTPTGNQPTSTPALPGEGSLPPEPSPIPTVTAPTPLPTGSGMTPNPSPTMPPSATAEISLLTPVPAQDTCANIQISIPASGEGSAAVAPDTDFTLDSPDAQNGSVTYRSLPTGIPYGNFVTFTCTSVVPPNAVSSFSSVRIPGLNSTICVYVHRAGQAELPSLANLAQANVCPN